MLLFKDYFPLLGSFWGLLAVFIYILNMNYSELFDNLLCSSKDNFYLKFVLHLYKLIQRIIYILV